MKTEVVRIGGLDVAPAADVITDMTAQELFGGAAEVLALGFLETTAVTVADVALNLEKAAVDLAALTVPVVGAAIGRYTEVSLAADASRFFDPSDTISLESDGGCTAGVGVAFIRYRRLS
jgi:hypothetical protein